MHTKPSSLARKFLSGLAAVVVTLLLAGCDLKVENTTPASVAENPSQIYTLSMRINKVSGAVMRDTIVPYIVVNGQNFKMTQSPLGEGLYDFDYQLPAGHAEVAYYYFVQYKILASGFPRERESYTEVQHTKVAKRNVIPLEVTRGPVGARVSVLGRGFTAQDVVMLDETPARTVFDSSNSLSFFVPAVAANKNYKVSVNSPSGNAPVGVFRVDSVSLQVSPSSLTLRSGETQNLTFTLPFPAAPGGVLLDITTDIPESVIMPEVVVPAGQTSVSIPIQGGKKGSGLLYLKGFGQGEVKVPVSVQ